MRLSSYPQWKFQFAIITAFLFLASCKKEEDVKNEFSIDIFYKQMESLTLEVAYETGAEPYDYTINGENVWLFAELNIESLFAQRPLQIDVLVPAGLAQMTLIPDQIKNGFTSNDILNLSDQYRQDEGNEVSGNIFILFLDGYFKQDDTVRQTIAGVHLSGTTVVAVFKPLVTSSHVTKIIREFVEQSIVIHEIGHAIGLVKNGLPLTSSHQDIDNGAHCINTDCVMYWQNERTTNVTSFVQSYLGESKQVIFGPECIADVTDYEP
ncbi:MAG: hypothetical protein SH857_14530 [Chitinophagales bacterium]|nr:hypothetical protein [Chitinophagales bacterium]